VITVNDSSMEKKIGGCVILYHPDKSVTANIATWYPDVDVMFMIDNSPQQHPELAVQQPDFNPGKIHYHWMGGNKGVASALNVACRLALQQECNWLLTMDQDSHFHHKGLAGMIARIDAIEAANIPVGIISPAHLISEHFMEEEVGNYKEVKYEMTSGNLLNLRAWQTVGSFEDKLFIDCVDMDYCLRLRKAGFRIIQVNGVHLQHSLGNFQVRKVAGIKMGISNHSPERKYYITRNKMYTLKKYFGFDPAFCLLVVRSMFGDLIRIIFFEKQKSLKLRAVLTGIGHWMIDRYGRHTMEKVPE